MQYSIYGLIVQVFILLYATAWMTIFVHPLSRDILGRLIKMNRETEIDVCIAIDQSYAIVSYICQALRIAQHRWIVGPNGRQIKKQSLYKCIMCLDTTSEMILRLLTDFWDRKLVMEKATQQYSRSQPSAINYEVRLLCLIFYTQNKWIEDAHKKGSLRHNGQTIKIKEILCKAKVASILLGDHLTYFLHGQRFEIPTSLSNV